MNCLYQLLVKRVAVSFAAILLFVGGVEIAAQSIDANVPTPVRSNTLIGKIGARDLGDSRLTNHYYTFRGTPGDLLITVQSRNLNGDIDVFTAGSLRPLLKLTLYAESLAPVTKGIYLRRPEELILRVEARSPNDDEGTYQFFFGGSFQPVEGGPEIADNESLSTATADAPATDRKTKRVSSVGARIDEPVPPVTEVATATPTPEATPEPSPIETPTVATDKPAEVEAPRTAPRATRNRRPAPRRNTNPVARPKETPTEEAKTEQPSETESEPKPKTPARGTRRGTTARAAQPEPEPEPEAEIGPRLIIETNDGTLINRSMSGVRRVTVENGQVVVVGKDGKIDRIRLANVVKMAIQP